MRFEIKPFKALTTKELFEIYKLRSEVFVVEQNCVYQDVDDEDLSAYHILAYTEKLTAYARLYQHHSEAKIGRVVVHQTNRNQGLGLQLMKYCLNKCSELMPGLTIAISAQQYLLGFYNGLGFVAEGDGYLEDGIPHIRMVLPPGSNNTTG